MRSRILKIQRSFYCCLLAISLSYSQTTYYISSSEGNDSNDGASAETPWKTPNKVTGHGPFQPGDFILFKRGDIFQGEITQQYLEGKVNQRIIFGAYGTGAKPIIYGDMTGATWTKTTGREGIWQAFSGYFYSSFAYEYYSADWHLLKDANNGDLHFSLSNPDSLTKFLNGLTASSYGYGNDTVWVKTWDGNSPNAHIFHEANFIKGNYVTVRDWDLRNFGTGIKGLSGGTYTNMIVHNLSIKNTTNIAIFLTGHYVDCIVDSCTVDSTGYTALYNQFGKNNIWRYNTVSNVGQHVLGIFINGSELCGIGMQQDTACVAEKNIFTNCLLAGIDTYFNVDDTVRNNTVTGCEAGVYLNGSGWVAQNNDISVTGQRSPGIRVDIHGTGLTKVENNTVSSPGLGLVAATSEPGGGTVIFNNNRVTCSYSNSNFTDYEITGITSTYNTFYGLGIYATGVWPNQMYYSTLAQFQAAAGYENGSVWYSSVAAPIGILTITPDTLTNIPGSVTLSWTTENATVVSIIPIIGVVDSASGSSTVTLTTNTVFVLTLNGPNGSTTYVKSVIVLPPQNYSLDQNYPNPFNGSTTIEFVLPNAGYASLKVFDTIGREIATLAEGSYSKGNHRFQWNVDGVASGVYYYTLKSGAFIKTNRMVLLR